VDTEVFLQGLRGWGVKLTTPPFSAEVRTVELYLHPFIALSVPHTVAIPYIVLKENMLLLVRHASDYCKAGIHVNSEKYLLVCPRLRAYGTMPYLSDLKLNSPERWL
jgi:hypothetical protein